MAMPWSRKARSERNSASSSSTTASKAKRPSSPERSLFHSFGRKRGAPESPVCPAWAARKPVAKRETWPSGQATSIIPSDEITIDAARISAGTSAGVSQRFPEAVSPHISHSQASRSQRVERRPALPSSNSIVMRVPSLRIDRNERGVARALPEKTDWVCVSSMAMAFLD